MSSIRYVAMAVVVAFSTVSAFAGEYFPPPFQGTVGQLRITNNSIYPITISLWHPDNRQVRLRYLVPGNSTEVALDEAGHAAFLGDNWGLQIGDSAIKPLSRCANFQDGPPYARFFNTSTDLFATR